MPGKRRFKQGKCGMDDQAHPCSRLYKVLASDQRLHILKFLQGGEKNSTEIIENLNLDSSVISRHLRMLRNFRLISVRKEGNTLFYSIADDRVFQIQEVAKNIIGDLYQWNLGKME